MSKIDELKEKALAALGTIIDKSTDLYENAEEKAKYIAKTTKLRTEIAKENTELKKLYTDLGSLYYCLNKDNPDEALSQLCEEIKLLIDKIDLKQRELESLSAEAAEKDIVVDISDEDSKSEDGETAAKEPSDKE